MQPFTTLLTIGHSNHSLAHFVLLLRRHQVTAVADVRSSPCSRRCPHFDREALAEALWASAGIRYVFLGQQLGARPEDPVCYTAEGRVSFERLARSLPFRNGVRRILKGLATYRIALMCAERDPLQCHRGILIAPRFAHLVGNILHIDGAGDVETHAVAERRLVSMASCQNRELFRTPDDRLREAYLRVEARIAWRRP